MNSKQRRTHARKNGIQRHNIIFSSCGNDSIALVRWMKENFPNDRNIILYSSTGWSMPGWEKRVDAAKSYAVENGFEFIILDSEGMENLVRRKKGWPMPASVMQFCTDELKVKPAKIWMDVNDTQKDLPHFKTRCFTGIRREESKNRASTPRVLKNSERHGGRALHCPLVEMRERERDELINKTGLDILPHSSMECFPCVCSNKSDFKRLAEFPKLIDKIEKIETEMGFTRNNKPRVMFRPYRHMGATGIREVVKWGMSDRGKYLTPEKLACKSGFCGF